MFYRRDYYYVWGTRKKAITCYYVINYLILGIILMKNLTIGLRLRMGFYKINRYHTIFFILS